MCKKSVIYWFYRYTYCIVVLCQELIKLHKNTYFFSKNHNNFDIFLSICKSLSKKGMCAMDCVTN